LKALTELGAFAESARGDGHAPIIIKGKLTPGSCSVVAQDSQVLSALLIACSFVDGTTHISAQKMGEKPWIKLTLDWMQSLGVTIENPEESTFIVHGQSRIPCFTYTVPGDFSSAAFPLAAEVVPGGELTLTHLDMPNSQGDKQLFTLIQQMGAEIDVQQETQRVTLKAHARLKGMEIDVNAIIDALPILAVLACYAEGETHLVTAGIARKKESDRLSAIATELKKMGARIEEKPESLHIQPCALHGADLEAHDDHRIAMALTVAALGASSESRIAGVECVQKSYGDFFTHMKVLGADVERRVS
jgi:3-phosphoshikimate 1-carboxyvinyltransferase